MSSSCVDDRRMDGSDMIGRSNDKDSYARSFVTFVFKTVK